MTVDNKGVYQSDELARQYSLADALQPPERTILETIKEHLRGARMLDIGVGGGRTTLHFAPLVEGYIGVDYSEQMISACRERFPEVPNRLTFQVADVRSLSMFPNESFDFILFSYNGIDYMPHEDRHAALQEIRRVLKKTGYFAFSTHNLNNLRARLRPQFILKPRPLASKLLWLYRFFKHNPGSFRLPRNGYVEVYDGALGYRLRTHYIGPEGAIEELAQTGFRDIRAFQLSTGKPIVDPQELRANIEEWLYYLCSG